MIAILLVTYLVIQIVDAIRSKDTFKMVAGVIGLGLAILVCLGAVTAPLCLRGNP